MEKTKLHIPATLLAAFACLLGYYGGYVILGIVVGYVLLAEENAWLKKFCLKILILMLGFSLASTVLNLLPSLLQLMYSFLEIFNVHVYLSFVHNAFNFIGQVLSLAKTLLFLLLGAATLMGKDVKIPGLDSFIEKHVA